MPVERGATSIESIANAGIIRLEDEFCQKNIQIFRDRLDEIYQQDSNYVVIDFSEVQLVDSKAMEALLDAIEEVQELGGLMKIACLSGRLKKVFEITQFDQIFEVYDDIVSAVRSFG